MRAASLPESPSPLGSIVTTLSAYSLTCNFGPIKSYSVDAQLGGRLIPNASTHPTSPYPGARPGPGNRSEVSPQRARHALLPISVIQGGDLLSFTRILPLNHHVGSLSSPPGVDSKEYQMSPSLAPLILVINLYQAGWIDESRMASIPWGR